MKAEMKSHLRELVLEMWTLELEMRHNPGEERKNHGRFLQWEDAFHEARQYMPLATRWWYSDHAAKLSRYDMGGKYHGRA